MMYKAVKFYERNFMINLQTYIAEQAKYTNDEETLATLEQLTQEQFDLAIKSILDYKDEELDNELPPTFKAALTRDTLDAFDDARATSWVEKGGFLKFEKMNIYTNFQPLKGQQRLTSIVLDLGDKRLVLSDF